MDSVKQLKLLTESLPQIPILTSLVEEKGNEIYTTYKTKSGTSIGFNLLNKPDVAVQELYVSKDTSFPEHRHEEEFEFSIIYKGSMLVKTDKGEQIYNKGDVIIFNKNEPHSGVAIEDTWMIAIAIPRIEGYPI